MKTISEYLNEWQFKEYIEQPLRISLYQWANIQECLDQSWVYINESNGVFDKQVELVKDIVEKLWRNGKLPFEYECKDDLFVEKIIIDFAKDNKTGYRYDLSKFNKDKTKFVYITIELDDSQKTFRSLLDIVIHEITHAYEDYNRKLKGIESFEDFLKKSSYVKAMQFYNYEKSGEQIISKIMYLTTKSELAALRSQLHNVLDDLTDFLSFNEVIDKYFFNHPIWKTYKENIVKFKNYKDKQELCDIYNKINDSNLTKDKFIKRISKQLDYFSKQFGKTICNLYWDYQDKMKDKIKKMKNMSFPEIEWEEYMKKKYGENIEEFFEF